MGCYRVDTQRGGRDAGKRQNIVGRHDFGLTEHWIAERDVDREGLAVHLSGELALCAEPEPFVVHPVVLDRGVIVVGADLKSHEVVKAAPSGILELGKCVVRRAHQSQVDILGGSRPLEAKLQREAALECGSVTKHGNDARQEAIEHQELSRAGEFAVFRDL